jgi:hypothetical protein
MPTPSDPGSEEDECVENDNCLGVEICVDGKCQSLACSGDDQCPNGTVCINGFCQDPCEICTILEECIDNKCVTSCNSDSNCPAGFICEDKICVAGCLSDEDCDENFECSKYRCIRKEKPEGFVDLDNNTVTIPASEKQENITIGCLYADPNCSYTHFDVLSDFADGSLFTVTRNDSLCEQRLLNDEDADPRSYTGYVLSLKSSDSCEPDINSSYCNFLFKLSAGYDGNTNNSPCQSVVALSSARVIKQLQTVEYLEQPTIKYLENGRLLHTGDPLEIMVIFNKNIVIDSHNGVSIYIEITTGNDSVKVMELKSLPVTSNTIKFRYIIKDADRKIKILYIENLSNVSSIDKMRVKKPENSIQINQTINDINYKPSIDCDI